MLVSGLLMAGAKQESEIPLHWSRQGGCTPGLSKGLNLSIPRAGNNTQWVQLGMSGAVWLGIQWDAVRNGQVQPWTYSLFDKC